MVSDPGPGFVPEASRSRRQHHRVATSPLMAGKMAGDADAGHPPVSRVAVLYNPATRPMPADDARHPRTLLLLAISAKATPCRDDAEIEQWRGTGAGTRGGLLV